jgi:hypothetical protein
MQKVVVIVNSGDNVISRHLLDELAKEAGADTWECIDLPTESRLTQRVPDVCHASRDGLHHWYAGPGAVWKTCADCGTRR